MVDDDDEGGPAGTAILGFIWFVGGVVLCFIGLTLTGTLIFGDVPRGQGAALLAGVLTLAAGLLFLATAVGTWFNYSWARTVGIITAIAGLAAGIWTLVTTGEVPHGIATIVFPIFLLWYLNRDKVKQAFSRD